MASMKPVKPSYSYDSSQSTYATSSYDRKFNQSGHNYQAQNSPLGRHMHNFHVDMDNQTRVTKPTKYYAQAQCAQPSEAIHVVQGNHVVEKIMKQDSHKSEDWTTAIPSPSQVAHSELTTLKEETVVENVDQGCANKLNPNVDSAQADQFGFGKRKEEHMVEKLEQGWVNKPTQYSTTSELEKCDDAQSWANKPTQYSSVAQSNQYGGTMHSEELMMAKVEQGLASKPTQYSSAAQSNQYGGTMHSEELMMAKAEQGWANKPTQYSSAAKSNQYGGAMHSEGLMMAKGEQGWANKPSQYAGTTQSNHYERSEGHMVGKPNQDGLTKPTQYLERTQSNQYTRHSNGHMMGNKEQGWPNKSNQYPNITIGNEYDLMVHKEEDMLGKIKNDSTSNAYANAYQAQVNAGVESMYNEQVGGAINRGVTRPSNYYAQNRADHSLQVGYNQHDQSHGWSAMPNKTLSPVRTSHTGKYNEVHMMGGTGHNSAYSPSHTGLGMYNEVSMYKDEHKMGKMDHIVAGSPGQFSSPNRRNQYGQSMYNEHGSEAYDYNSDNNVHSGWANQQSKYLDRNQHGAYSGHNMYKEDAWAGKAGHRYSATPANYLANGAYNYDHEDCEEDVHDIMDEILAKYPAHNVSGGRGNGWEAKSGLYMNQNQVGGYGQQQSYAAPALYGSSAYSSGYMANVKEEYSSHSSRSSSKFEMRGMAHNGGLFDDE